MPYFDFHCHPGLKPTFSNQTNAISPWSFIDTKLAIFKDVTISINPLFNEVLNSQIKTIYSLATALGVKPKDILKEDK